MKRTPNTKKLLDLLKPLSFFSKDIIIQLGRDLGLEETSVDVYISRFLKYKKIMRLKKGLYVSVDFFNTNKDSISYKFYLANIIRKPSYISSWTALQYYGLVTEIIYQTISISTKLTRNYLNKAGNFAYKKIKKDLFTDFYLKEGEFSFYIASPAKALFDLLYFKTNQFHGISVEDVGNLINELRIDFDEMKKTEQDKFYSILNKYYE